MSAHPKVHEAKQEAASPLQPPGPPGQTAAPPKPVASVPATSTKGAAPVAPAAPAADTKFFYILIADNAGRDLNPPAGDDKPGPQDPHDPRARQISFKLRPEKPQSPPIEQMQLHTFAERILHAISHLYPPGEPAADARFRPFYVRVFHVARLALETGSLGIDAAKRELEAIEKDLVDDEGPAIKNSRIRELLKWSALFALPAVAAYTVLCYVRPGPGLGDFLKTLQIDPAVLANFMLVWLGCFIGVCLSYTLRKPNFTLEDLVMAESDFLRPSIRLAFAGILTMLLVMLAMFHVVDAGIGTIKLSSVADGVSGRMAAFVVGVFCGISELLLPARIMGKQIS